MHLRSVDVIEDGNRFFRALSLNMYGNQNSHMTLRHSMAKNISSQSAGITPEDLLALRQHAADVMRGDPDQARMSLLQLQTIYNDQSMYSLLLR